MVMNRSSFPKTLMHAFSLSRLVIEFLQDDRDAFPEEDAADYRDEEFLMHDDRRHRDDAAYGETTRVAHEYLCGI